MPKRTPAFLAELPAAPDYSLVANALEKTNDPEVIAALRSFASMPASTGVFANPVRRHHTVACGDTPVELRIRSFSIRGCLLEEDIVTGAADAIRVIFVGLFGRFAKPAEAKSFAKLLADEFDRAAERVIPLVASFTKRFPDAPPAAAMQYVACVGKTGRNEASVSASVPPAKLLRNLITVHLENVAAGACASYMRFLRSRRREMTERALVKETRRFVRLIPADDPFRASFSLLLRRVVNQTEARILGRMGAIQIHHGSAGSNMVARYFASLHTKSISDLFTASQMTLDCARHFGAISEFTEFVGRLEHTSPQRRDDLIRARAVQGNLPAFGHPEIAAAGRENRIEVDPRPAIYLAPLFEAIDTGALDMSDPRRRRVAIAQRMYQLAFVEGIEKPGRAGRLRIAPNTDFGAWLVQEALGIEEPDRTQLSYIYRGFGWMMDVREQLQQPVIRPVIPPDPGIIPPLTDNDVISAVLSAVHARLSRRDAFARVEKNTR